MDELGIDIQVLYTSIFLDQVTERADTEVALCGAYNRWMADVWKQSKGRLRWMANLPLLSMPDALDQLKFAKENGGCGVFMRPLEGARQVSDPYFFPLYEQAEKMNFCIGLHQSNGSAAAVDMMVNPDGSRDFFNQYQNFQRRRDVPPHQLRHPAEISQAPLRLHRNRGNMGAVGGLRAAPALGQSRQSAAR